MAEYISDEQYIAIKPEAIENTPITPTIMLPLISENLRSNLNRDRDKRMSGIDWDGTDLLKGRREHAGTVEFYCDVRTLAHLFNMLYTKGSTTGDATDGYTHPFSPGDPDSYTIEVTKGLYAQRFYGCKIDNLKLEFDNNKLKATADIRAVGQFSVATLDGDLSGAVTELYLQQLYDLKPNSGLVSGDVIVVGGTELTLTSVDSDGLEVGFGSTSVTASDGDPVYLKKQDYSAASLQNILLEGNCLVGVGADESAATTAAGSKANATPVEGLSIEFNNNLFQQAASGQSDPIKIIPGTKSARITLNKLFENTEQHQKWLDKTKQAITVIITGDYIKTDRTTHEKMTAKFYNVKLNPNENPITFGEYIKDNQTFEALYDSSDGKAVALEVVNKTAGTEY
jgi:hypothetical protein